MRADARGHAFCASRRRPIRPRGSPLAALRHRSWWGTDEFFSAHHHRFGKALGSRAAGRIGWC